MGCRLGPAGDDADPSAEEIADAPRRSNLRVRSRHDATFAGREGVGDDQVVAHQGRQSGHATLPLLGEDEDPAPEESGLDLGKLLPHVVVPGHQARASCPVQGPRGCHRQEVRVGGERRDQRLQ